MSASDKSFPVLRWIIIFLAFVLVAGIIYDGSIFYSRWRERRETEQSRADSETSKARRAIESVGGGGLRILSFYAAPGLLKSGQPGRLCYGVTGAKTLRLEPPVDEVWPALTRCLQISPRKNTEYKLTADDGAGHTTTESVLVRVTH